MFEYEILYSDSKQNPKIIEQLYDNVGLQDVLRNQGLVFEQNQIKQEQNLYQNCFKRKHLPYYNFVECPTYISTHDIEKDMIICILDIPYYMPLRIEIFIDKVFEHPFINKMMEESKENGINIKQFLKGFLEIKAVKKKMIEWVDAFFYYTKVFTTFPDDITYDLDRLKIYIEMYYEVISNKKTNDLKKYSCPLIKKCNTEIQYNMLDRKQQNWEVNTTEVTVHFKYKQYSSTFIILVSTCDITKGDRLFHEITLVKEDKIITKLLSNWPFVLQIEEEIYIPKQLWNVPVDIEGEIYNLFDRFIERINSNDSMSKCTFEIGKLLKKYYEIINMNELEKKYNIVQCRKNNNIIRVINYLDFKLLQ